MRIENNDVRTSRAAWFFAEGGEAKAPMNGCEAGPTSRNAYFATRAPDVGAGDSKRDRTARALERGITWESLLLLGVAVAVAFLAIAAWQVADFGAQFVARTVATELVTVPLVRVRPANVALLAHDAPNGDGLNRSPTQSA